MLINPVYIELRAEARFAKTKKAVVYVSLVVIMATMSGILFGYLIR